MRSKYAFSCKGRTCWSHRKWHQNNQGARKMHVSCDAISKVYKDDDTITGREGGRNVEYVPIKKQLF